MAQEEFKNKDLEIDEMVEKKEENSVSQEIQDKYKFGWSGYSEITNGRFAMLGFLAIILIELFSHKSFLNWAGFFN